LMNRSERDTSGYFETGLLILAVVGVGMVAYWGLK